MERFSGIIHHAILATLRRYGAEDASADRVADLYQQAFLALYEDNQRRLRSFKGTNGCSLATWLRVLVSRLVIDDLRRSRPPDLPLDADPPGGEDGPPPLQVPDPGPGAESLTAARQTEAFFQTQIAGLPARERLALQLRFEQGLSGEEAARVMGVTRNNLDQIVHRVKSGLRKKAEELGYL